MIAKNSFISFLNDQEAPEIILIKKLKWHKKTVSFV